jgi:hypothetical protein
VADWSVEAIVHSPKPEPFNGDVPSPSTTHLVGAVSIDRRYLALISPVLNEPIDPTPNDDEYKDGKSSPRHRRRVAGILPEYGEAKT